ncbi:MAG: L-seryl-tRNA(Sec) selenium transferase [Armatimonadota bacterium]|nr:L-seryl-tRNA(Sec) selenium transferase [Armatimonadota bacterium]
MTNKNLLRSLPSIDRLLGEPSLKELIGEIPRPYVAEAARKTLDEIRSRIREGFTVKEEDISLERLAQDIRLRAKALANTSIRRAINATGIVLHTGLGRAVLPAAAQKALIDVASGHCNLEIDIKTGGRGKRSEHYQELLKNLTGAESALVVNNNAAAVFLALNTLACGREVIVSRGELVEIGGSFRMPDIMASAGVKLIEVGTTNRTYVSDYENAISEETGLILKVHTSNFCIVGFAKSPALSELAELGKKKGIPVMEDIGSGALIDMSRFGLKSEPTVQESIRAGADIVTFSGDKLLGGPQSGIIVGRKEFVEAMARNPLSRTFRIDKLTIAALEATLKLYVDSDTVIRNIPTLRYISRTLPEITHAANQLKAKLITSIGDNAKIEIFDGFSEVGGGSLPGQQLPTKLIAIYNADISPIDLAQKFREANPPIFGRVGDDKFLLDIRTVEDSEIDVIAQVASQILSH